MRTPRLDRFAASTAVALVLAMPCGLAFADPDDPAPFESRQSIADVTGATPSATVTGATPSATATVAPPTPAPAASDIEARIPLPEPADVPPITASSLDAAPAATETPQAYASASAASTPAPAPVDAAILNAIPTPEPADVPPPSLKDVGKNPLGSMNAADLPVAEQMRELILGRLDRMIPGRKERAAVEAFYQGRGFAPLWIDNGRPGVRMKTAAARLKAADADGLEPGDYACAGPQQADDRRG